MCLFVQRVEQSASLNETMIRVCTNKSQTTLILSYDYFFIYTWKKIQNFPVYNFAIILSSY